MSVAARISRIEKRGMWAGEPLSGELAGCNKIKHRKTGARRDISLMALTDAVAFAQRNTKVWGSEVDLFGGLFA